ncbi:hypothetical protein ACOI9R_38285, partial [Mesorhizobium japonicum]
LGVLDEVAELLHPSGRVDDHVGRDAVDADVPVDEVVVPEYRYMCSLQLARKTYHLESYRLPSVAMAAGFDDFAHHDAVADSEACAAIVIHAAERWGAVDLPELATLA